MNFPLSIYGVHDEGGESLIIGAGRRGYVVITEGIGHNPAHAGGRDYTRFSNQGIVPLVRLNNGYSPDGTIPLLANYGDFATRVGNWVSGSKGAACWIIGNEPGHSQERPNGVPITPASYAQCFAACEQAIHARAGHADDLVIPAPIAPWNNQTSYAGNEVGDWVVYFRDVLAEILRLGGQVGGIALHTYTHGADPALITSPATMGPPFQHRLFNFLCYLDFLPVIPATLRTVPVFITETDQDSAWLSANNGWVQAAYREIDAWNHMAGMQRIYALCLYRYGNYDR